MMNFHFFFIFPNFFFISFSFFFMFFIFFTFLHIFANFIFIFFRFFVIFLKFSEFHDFFHEFHDFFMTFFGQIFRCITFLFFTTEKILLRRFLEFTFVFLLPLESAPQLIANGSQSDSARVDFDSKSFIFYTQCIHSV